MMTFLDSDERDDTLVGRTTKPLARSDRLLVERIADQMVAYDTESKVAHSLSPLAAAVFDHCNGETPVGGITEAASKRLGEPVDEASVYAALAHCKNATSW